MVCMLHICMNVVRFSSSFHAIRNPNENLNIEILLYLFHNPPFIKSITSNCFVERIRLVFKETINNESAELLKPLVSCIQY